MGNSVLYRVYLGDLANPTVQSLQAAAMGQADRNLGKVSSRTEFYQRLKALNANPVVAPTKGQAVIVGVPSTSLPIANRIAAIKALRELTTHDIKQAKDFIDMVDGRCFGVSQSCYHFPSTDIATANHQAKVMREAGCTVQVNLS